MLPLFPMNENEKYFAKALAWSIRTDFELVKWLVDTASFNERAISNIPTQALYLASARAYAKMAPTGYVPGVEDVTVELANMTNDDIASEWGARIHSMDAPNTSSSRSVATGIMESYDRGQVLTVVDQWTQSVLQSNKPINKMFGSLTDQVYKALSTGPTSGRPKDILESARSSDLVVPQSTGYDRLDMALDGGWTPSKLYICGMPSGHGKTSLCCNFASRRCENGEVTLIHSFEMTARDLLFRMICDIANVTLDAAEYPTKMASEEEQARIAFAENLIDNFVRVYDTPADAAELERRIRRHKVEFSGQTILSIIDHIGIMRRGSRGNDWAELETMMYNMADMAHRMNSPILANSQVPVEVETELVQNNILVYNKDFRGSRGVRNAVDYAIFGCRHNSTVTDGEGTLTYDSAYRYHTVIQTTKNRRTGNLFWGVFAYDPIYYRVLNSKAPGTAEDIYGT